MGPVINSQLAILHSQLLQNEMGTVLTLLFSRFDVVDYTNNLINPKYNYDELQHLVVICDDGYLMSCCMQFVLFITCSYICRSNVIIHLCTTFNVLFQVFDSNTIRAVVGLWTPF